MKLLKSIRAEMPMHVVPFCDFQRFGSIPRSSDAINTQHLPDVPWDGKLIFVSHRWLRPWHNQKDCEREGHQWAGRAHPDDAAGSKYKLICEGVCQLAMSKEWEISQVFCG
jgi:hypothetical protein